MKTTSFLKGKKCFLQPVEQKDLKKNASLIVKWVNDPIVTFYMFTGQKPLNQKQLIEDFNKQLEAGNNIIFLIADHKTKRPIGYAGLYEIQQTAQKAEIRILIGEKNFWGNGYGTEAVELLTFYGFDRLNLHRIYLGYTADNIGAGRAYKKAGFKYEGRLKEDIYRNSKYYDSIRMGILKDEYYKKYYPIHQKKFN